MTDAPRRTVRRVLRDALYAAANPLFRLAVRFIPEGNRWERLPIDARPEYHGAAHDHDFTDYLRGGSAVTVTSVDEIDQWLRECAYREAPALIGDWTKRARDFEMGRIGNCLDHALWAWRKLGELGYAPQLVVGRRFRDSPGRHAWVVFEREGQSHLAETIAKEATRPMVSPRPDEGDEYWPEFGIDAAGQRFVYGGYVGTLRARSRK